MIHNSGAIKWKSRYKSCKLHSRFGFQTVVVLLAVCMAADASAFTVLASSQTDYATFEDFRSGNVQESGYQGKRQKTEYITVEINKEADLEELAANCRLDAWSADKYVKLNQNITLQDNSGLTIPSFAGIFDGNGYRITNLHILGNGSSQGFFRYLQQGGEIRNLNVEGEVAPEGSRNQVGGIVGINYGLIYNCTFSGIVEGDNEAGGIAGLNAATGEIRKCTSHAVINANHSAGGITGNNHGTLNNCTNTGDVNTYSTEVIYELDDITMENFENINSTSNVSVHTDSGGIAGLSDGKIYYCSNSGTIGYDHVGYNTGGIVGRLSQGYLQNCTNTGHVLGRKDVGGIAGQMEPFLEIQYLNDRLSELDRELDYTIELMDRLHGDVSSYGKQASSLLKLMTTNLKNVSSAAGNLSGIGNDLWYIYNQELNGAANDIKILNNDLKDIGSKTGQDQDSNDQTDRDSVSTGDIKDAVNDVIDKIESGESENWKQNTDDAEAYRAALEKFGTNTGKHLDNMTGAANDRTGGISNNLNVLDKEMQSAVDYLWQLTDVLGAAGDKTSDDVDALVEQAKVLRRLISDIRDDLFSYEGITVRDTSDEAAGGELTDLGAGETDPDQNGKTDSTVTSGREGQNGTGADAGGSEESAVVDQNSSQMRDSAARKQEEEKMYDTSSFQKGKITLCLNKGRVEADTNVGGIVGQIATEFDFDPEDDITLTGKESFDMEQTIKAVVRQSRNLGDITGKKDYVGGVAGKADFGAIISCESYGNTDSTGGSYVGGIAGSSSYAVRSSYSMGNVDGKNYVGGIAGKGSDIFYSYAMNTIHASGEGSGAIAGRLAEEGTLYGNYYVEEENGGVDGIGYQGGAAPLAYEQFSALENLPEAFTTFTITFQAEGRELASYTCHYGDSLSAEQIPEIPEKEGYYGVWPKFNLNAITGSRVLEAQYEKWNGSVASRETEESGKSLLLAEGNFLPEAKLEMTQNGEEITFDIVCDSKKEERHPAGMSDHYMDSVKVRVFCTSEPENMEIEVKMQDGSYHPVQTQVMGSYLTFAMERPGTFRLHQKDKNNNAYLIVIAVSAAAILILLLVIGKKLLHNTNKRKQTERQAAQAEEAGDFQTDQKERTGNQQTDQK